MDNRRSLAVPPTSAPYGRRAGDRRFPFAPFVAQVAGLSLPRADVKVRYPIEMSERIAPAPLGLVTERRA